MDCSQATGGFVAVVYNPLAQNRFGFVDIPMSWSDVGSVTDGNGKAVDWQIVESLSARGSEGEGGTPYTLVLPVAAGPLGVQVLHVTQDVDHPPLMRTRLSSAGSRVADGLERYERIEAFGQTKTTRGASEDSPEHEQRVLDTEGSTSEGAFGLEERPGEVAEDGRVPAPGQTAEREDFILSNGLVALTFDGESGRLKSVENLEEGAGGVLEVNQGWYYYATYDSTDYRERADGTDNASARNGGVACNTDEKLRREEPKPEEALRLLHQELPHRITGSQNQAGGAYIFRPQEEDEPPQPVGVASSREEAAKNSGNAGSGPALKDWWISSEGPLVWEVHQVTIA